MPENFELLETGQIEIMHEQVHSRLNDGDGTCDELRIQHDSLAAELVKRGLSHDTEIICPEIETDAPNYRRGFTNDVCTNCAFGQLFPFCNLYKFDYLKGYTCDSFRYFEVLELEPPHGFLMLSGKQTAIASPKFLDAKKDRLIVSNGEVFGIASLEPKPVQLKTKEFDSDDWVNQHRVTSRERRQWWPGNETFYVYRLKNWYPYEGVKLFENGKVIDEPKLTAKQWQLVSKSKELPKQITLIDDAVSVTENNEFVIDSLVNRQDIESVLSATYETDVKDAKNAKEVIPVYSLALVRNPRMRVSKKNGIAENKQEEIEAEGEIMPFSIVTRDDQFCVINSDTEEVMGCHDTESEADDQLAALNINVTDEEKNKPYDKGPGKRKPKKKEANFLDGLKSLYKSIADFLSLAENENDFTFDSDIGMAQKTVNGELWHFTWSTNAFRDREGEIFSTKSLEKYVAANEINEDKGFFNLWHINAEDGYFNTDFAVKRWQGVVGRFLVEAGPYLDDEKGQAAKRFFAKYKSGHPEIAPEGWGCSPEYKYLPEERITTIYENIWITRTSTLPKMEAANVWTESSQLERGAKMALNEKQMAAAIETFGQDFVNQMIAEGEIKTTELESAGVAHKGVIDEGEQAQAQAQDQTNVSITQDQFEVLAEQVAKQFNVNNDAIVEAMANMAEGLKGVLDRVERLESQADAKSKAEVPSFTFSLQRASESDKTIVAEGDKLKDKKPKESQQVADPKMVTPAQFFGQSS